MSAKLLNVGDLRTTIDFEQLQKAADQDLVGKVKRFISEQRPCTFYQLSENDSFVKVHMATGFYMEKHDKTVHTEIHYLQFSKADGWIFNYAFDPYLLKDFGAIGITVTE